MEGPAGQGEASLLKGTELYEEGRYSEAIEVLSKYYEKEPNDIDTLVVLAGCYLGIHHFTKATRFLLKADELQPDDAMIKYNLAYSLLCMGRLNDAMQHMEECMGLNPPPEIKKMAKKLIESRKEFESKLENNYPLPLEEEFECEEKFMEAQIHLYNQRFDEAISIYQWILDKKPNFERAIQNIGVPFK